MLDLLDLRRLANQTLQNPFAAASGRDDDRIGRQNDLPAAARRTNSDGVHSITGPTGRGVSAEDPVAVALAQDLDQTTFRNAAVRQSDRP